MRNDYDVIVIGGGHAGCEAALAAARLGCRTVMLTLRPDRIGYMPCNPAVGGLAKGHLVKELDALGGEIARATDIAGIQFRMLNRAKGPAVWSPRAQVDKDHYSATMRYVVENQPNLEVVSAEVSGIHVESNSFAGVNLSNGSMLRARTCVVTTGTFLRGLMHVGDHKTNGGREGEPRSTALSDSLQALGLRMGRLKTGTPPRVLRDSVDLARFEAQPGDADPAPFSHRTDRLSQQQEPCYLTHTTERAHDVIRANLERAPMYRGDINAIGTRYCPSIEDKVVRFPDRIRHQIFIEPEGRDHPELYLNGISTSLPVDVQEEILRSIPGLDTAVMARPGYAVEYDFFFPDQLKRTMESKLVERLFFAGQINGTSGYEEAAAQGFVAGVNAVKQIRDDAPFVLRRDEAYIGVLIDDLTTKEIDEPYRMFTSRAEYRLLLRQDNADERLMPHGVAMGLVGRRALDAVEARSAEVSDLIARLERTPFPGVRGNVRFGELGLPEIHKPVNLLQVLKRPEVRIGHVLDVLGVEAPAPAVASHVECVAKYTGYIDRQQRDIALVQELEDRVIPVDFGYDSVHGLSTEARQKLQTKRPETIGQASRIDGVRASDLSILAVYLERDRRSSRRANAG